MIQKKRVKLSELSEADRKEHLRVQRAAARARQAERHARYEKESEEAAERDKQKRHQLYVERIPGLVRDLLEIKTRTLRKIDEELLPTCRAEIDRQRALLQPRWTRQDIKPEQDLDESIAAFAAPFHALMEDFHAAEENWRVDHRVAMLMFEERALIDQRARIAAYHVPTEVPASLREVTSDMDYDYTKLLFDYLNRLIEGFPRPGIN